MLDRFDFLKSFKGFINYYVMGFFKIIIFIVKKGELYCVWFFDFIGFIILRSFNN